MAQNPFNDDNVYPYNEGKSNPFTVIFFINSFFFFQCLKHLNNKIYKSIKPSFEIFILLFGHHREGYLFLFIFILLFFYNKNLFFSIHSPF